MRRGQVSKDDGGPLRELAGTGCAILQGDDHRHDGAAGEDRRETALRALLDLVGLHVIAL